MFADSCVFEVESFEELDAVSGVAEETEFEVFYMGGVL